MDHKGLREIRLICKHRCGQTSWRLQTTPMICVPSSETCTSKKTFRTVDVLPCSRPHPTDLVLSACKIANASKLHCMKLSIRQKHRLTCNQHNKTQGHFDRQINLILSGSGTVMLAHDMRPSAEELVKAAGSGVKALGGLPIVCGLLTTPQLHWMVRRSRPLSWLSNIKISHR